MTNNLQVVKVEIGLLADDCGRCRSHLSDTFVGDVIQLSSSLFDFDDDDDYTVVCQ